MKSKQYAQPCEIFSRGEVEDYTVNITLKQLVGTSVAQNISMVQKQIATLSLYPNPAKSHIILNFGGWKDVISICVYDVSGKLVESKQVINANQLQLDVSLLKPGIYMLRVLDKAGNMQTLKFIKE